MDKGVEEQGMKNIEDYCPNNKKEWRGWLELNHEKRDAVWVVFYKKKSIDHNLSWSDAVDEALCFGWIDSTKKRIDDERFRQYFTKRKAKSNWSRINKEKVKALIGEGLMRAKGFESIEVAKQNGSWTALNEVEALIVPEDLKKEFVNYAGSADFFEGLSNSGKRGLLYWIASAKRKETRLKRIIEVAKSAGKNQKPERFRQ